MEQFVPSVNGYPFANDFPPAPILRLRLPLYGEVDVGDASLGLCGGMTFAALDLWHAGELPPATPDVGLLIRRQIDSIGGAAGALRVWAWTAEPDAALAARSAGQWRELRTALASGPVPLMLIRAHSIDPHATARNHQVLAVASADDEVRVYDCNHPGDDGRSLAPHLGGWLYGGGPLRGFYVNRAYRPQSP